jgi:ornithine cyclodeaminase/alanine dehydrogenase-like protein (mu-crystallin family)
VADRLLRYLSRADVERAGRSVDAVGAVRRALLLHAQGRTTLPAEAYLAWITPEGSAARSLALPGALHADQIVAGLKVINSSLGNLKHGIPRAQGITLLFDPETAHPVAIMEAAYLSALRTAAYTALSVAQLAASVTRVGIIGCGVIGMAHAELLRTTVPSATFVLFDLDPGRLRAAAERLGARGLACDLASSAQAAVQGSSVVVTATTTTAAGYIPYAWLAPGTLVAHVSLDDVLPDVVARADRVIVDDWNLVRDDSRRLLGRLYRSGSLTGPETAPTGPTVAGARAVDGTLADVISGRRPGRGAPGEVILSNPFGMGILDVALAAEVVRAAKEQDLGIGLPV